MASVLEHASTSKPERYVEDQLAQARRKVRALDVGRAVLGLVIGTLVYGLAMVYADKYLVLPAFVRVAALGGFVVAALAYLYFVLLRPLSYRINPYYAARRVERTLPDAKNSIVNYLDLRDADLSAPMRAALGKQAADDLEGADLDEAIPGRSLVSMIAVASVLGVATFLSVMYFRPTQFLSLLDRVFSPLTAGSVAKRTTIAVSQPAGGDAVVPINQSVHVAVFVEGRIPPANKPDSLRLLLRHNPEEPVYDELPLEQGRDNREWSVRVPANLVQNGFWYKVAGGDDETPEYRVSVRSSPLMTRFDVTYTFRPYLKWEPRRTNDPNLEALRGTKVTLVAHANRTVRDGHLRIEGDATTYVGERVPNQPDALAFEIAMERESRYRIWFTSVEGESNVDPLPYTLKVIPDQVPRVEFTEPEILARPEPESDLHIPSDGLLELQGVATDDFGLRKVTLRMKRAGGADLPAKPFRDDKAFRLANGGYVRSIGYRDFVELDKLPGAPFAAKTVLEFWLEAEDNCDYPKPNVGRTLRTYKVIVEAPRNNPDAKKDERDRADEGKKDNDRKQDDKREKEDKANKADAGNKGDPKPDPNAANKPDPNAAKKPDPNGAGKPDPNANDPNAKPNEPKKGDGEKGANDDKRFEDLKNELEKQAKNEKSKGESKPDPDKKDGDNPKPEEPNAEPKGDPKPDPMNKPGDPKGDGPMDQPGANAGEKKPEGNPEPMPNPAESKPDGATADPNAKGDPKGDDKAGASKEAGTKKDGGDPNAKPPDDGMGNPDPMGNKPGAGKPDPSKKPDPTNPMDPNEGDKGEAKGEGQPEKAAAKNDPKGKTDGSGAAGQDNKEKGVAKPDPKQQNARAEPKADGSNGMDTGEPAGTSKTDKGDPKNAAKAGDPKPSPENGDGSDKVAANKPDANEPKPGDGAAGGDKDVKRLADQMKNGDPSAKKEAASKLEDMAKNDPDPSKREAAKDALNEAKGDGTRTADAKKPPAEAKPQPPKNPTTGEPEKVAHNKPGDPNGAGSGKTPGKGDEGTAKADPKPGENANAPSDKPGDPKGKPADPKDASAAKGKTGVGKPDGDAKTPPPDDASIAKGDAGKGEPGAGDPGKGAAGKPGDKKGESKPTPSESASAKANPDGDAEGSGSPSDGPNTGNRKGSASGPDAAANGPEPDAENAKRAGNLQLEDLDRRATKELLKKHNISEAEWRRHVDAERARLAQQKADAATAAANDATNVTGGTRSGPSNQNTAAARVAADPNAKPGDLSSTGVIQAPPGYEEAAAKFTEAISRNPTVRKKK